MAESSSAPPTEKKFGTFGGVFTPSILTALGTWYLVAAGVFAATLSSAMGSFLGAPRILQALARDRIYPTLKVFAAGARDTDEPRRALLATMVITVAVLLVASGEGGEDGFNLIASVVTMFFLVTYGIVNVAAFVESLGANPSFRPRFRFFHWSTALVGTLGCCGSWRTRPDAIRREKPSFDWLRRPGSTRSPA